MSRSLDPVVTARAIVAADVIVARSAVIGASTRFVPSLARRDLAAVAMLTGGLLAAVACMAAMQLPMAATSWPTWCVAIAGTGLALAGQMAYAAPRVAPHWLVELLTVSGPVPVYWAATSEDAARVAKQLSAIVPQ